MRVSIQDHGVGITPEVQARLFTPFTQAAGSTARRFGGTGLGLSICKRLLETMGGQLGVTGQLGAAATFWFALPLRPASAQPAGPAAQIDAWRQIVPVVVAKKPALIQTLALYRRSWGAPDVHVLADVQGVQAQKPSPSVWPVDDAGPDFQTVQTLAVATQKPIIVITAQEHDTFTPALKAAGATALLHKPLRQADIDDSIQAILADKAPNNASS